VGEKIVITSSKPQTTRRAVRGVVHRDHGQLVIVDTPGVHRPRTLLGQRLNDVVEETLAEVDVVGFCVPADEELGPGDRFINEWVDKAKRAKKVALVTKVELVSKAKVAEQLLALAELRDWDAIIPVSSLDDINLEPLVDELIGLMPESEALYPADMITEERYAQRVEELIREAALEGVHDELPHSIAVQIEVIVERDSQKGIVIGKGAQRLKMVRQHAAKQISAISPGKVKLTLHVKVAKDWQRDPKQLGRLGF
jgi:GTP-binding protein Era